MAEEKRKKYMQEYYKKNKAKLKKQALNYYWENRDEIREKFLKKYHKNKNEIKKYQREYYQKNKEARRAYHKEYQKNNPQVRKKADAKRRELLKKAREEVEPYTRYDVIDRDSIDGIPICQLCNKSLKLEEVEIDHIIPLAKGGKDELSNVRVLCSLCNASRPRDGRDLC